MKKFASVIAFGLLAIPSLAHALSFEVLGKCGETVAKAEDTKFANDTVLGATASILDSVSKANVKAGKPPIPMKTNVEGTYVASIGELGETVEKAGSEVRAWGWNVKLNGTDLKESPSVVEISYGDKDSSIQWIYGYVKMDAGKTKCTESEDCPFHAGSQADCAAKTVEAEKPAAPANPSYQVKDDGCDTGYHEFATVEALCAGLKDEELNQNCGQSIRKEIYASFGCAGPF